MSLKLARVVSVAFIIFCLIHQNIGQFHFFENEPDHRCITPSGQPGVCEKINKCTTLFEAFEKKVTQQPEPAQYLRNALCEMGPVLPIVCCDIDTGPCTTPEDQIGKCVPLERCQPLSKFLSSNPGNHDYREASRCSYNGIEKGDRYCCPIFTVKISGTVLKPQVPNIPSMPAPIPVVANIPSMPAPIPVVPNVPSTPAPVPVIPNIPSPPAPVSVIPNIPSMPAPVPVVASDPIRLQISTAEPTINNKASLPTPGEELGQCGTHEPIDKIINGNISDIYEYPWMALLGMGDGSWGCGGSLITDRYILTAAHCVTEKNVRERNNVTTIRLGEFDLETEMDCVFRLTYQDCITHQDFVPEEIIVHPGYMENTLENDIALIRLTKVVIFSESIRPVCLPRPPFDLQGNENFTVAGWGRNELSLLSTKKTFLDTLFLADEARCTSSNIRLTRGMLCIGSRKGQGTCYGDSGGPLMALRKVPRLSIVYYQIGIVSFGTTNICALPNRPNVYTKVENYFDWIVNNIRT